MTVKVGRNDACPCGSGEKYKKCCLAAETGVDLRHRVDSQLRVRLMDYSQARFGRDAFAVARDGPIAEDALPIFIPWMLFHHRIDGHTVVEWYLQERGSDLEESEKAWLLVQTRTPLAVWKVVQAVPGQELLLENTLTGGRRTVLDVAASRSLRPLQHVLARVTDEGPTSLVVGSHPSLLSPSQAFAVEEAFRREIGTDVLHRHLLEGSSTLRLMRLWEQQVLASQGRPGALSNSDGEALDLTAMRWTFDPPRRQDVFRTLAASGDGEHRVEALGGDFLVISRGTSTTTMGTVVATVSFGPDHLEVQTNSLPRAAALRTHIEQAAAGALRFVEKRPIDMGTYTQTLHRAAPTQEPSLDSGMQAMRQFKSQHYQKWLDEPLPFLQGETPRHAATTPQGRRRVTVLLDDMDMRERQEPLFVRYDIGSLRRDLGLEG